MSEPPTAYLFRDRGELDDNPWTIVRFAGASILLGLPIDRCDAALDDAGRDLTLGPEAWPKTWIERAEASASPDADAPIPPEERDDRIFDLLVAYLEISTVAPLIETLDERPDWRRAMRATVTACADRRMSPALADRTERLLRYVHQHMGLPVSIEVALAPGPRRSPPEC